MLIEATPRDSAAILAMLPVEGAPPDELPMERMARLGEDPTLSGPDGVTVRFDGMMQFRSVDVAPVMSFLVEFAAGVSAGLVTAWIVEEAITRESDR